MFAKEMYFFGWMFVFFTFQILNFFAMNIYVGNLNYRIKEDDLKAVFEDYGQVESVKIISDKMSGRSKGFGFVEMPDDAEARAAMEALNESEYEGRKMIVNEARPRREFNDR